MNIAELEVLNIVFLVKKKKNLELLLLSDQLLWKITVHGHCKGEQQSETKFSPFFFYFFCKTPLGMVSFNMNFSPKYIPAMTIQETVS